MTDLQSLLGYLTPISLTVGVFYYIMSLRNQNKARKTQLYMQMTDKLGDTTQLEERSKYSALEWSTPEEYMEIWKSAEGRRTIGTLGAYFEGLGILVKENLLDIRVVALFHTGNLNNYWSKFMPMIGDLREAMNWPSALKATEYLYNELMKYLKEHPELKT